MQLLVSPMVSTRIYSNQMEDLLTLFQESSENGLATLETFAPIVKILLVMIYQNAYPDVVSFLERVSNVHRHTVHQIYAESNVTSCICHGLGICTLTNPSVCDVHLMQVYLRLTHSLSLDSTAYICCDRETYTNYVHV